MSVTAHVYGGTAASHPDVDTRDLQTYLSDRLEESGQGGVQGRARATSLSRVRSFRRSETQEGMAASMAPQQAGSPYVFSPANEGWLMKRGSQGPLKLFWRRWVVLEKRKLYYMTAPPGRREEAGPDK
jgi:hypothetical protein